MTESASFMKSDHMTNEEIGIANALAVKEEAERAQYLAGPGIPLTKHSEMQNGVKRAGTPTGYENMDVEGYEHLARILADAYNQAARGKGKVRHAGEEHLPFHDQPIMAIARMSGLGGHVYQIMKKAGEAQGMHSRDEKAAAIREFYGVINYAAAAILLIEKN